MRKKLTISAIFILLLAVASITVASAAADDDGKIQLIAKTVQEAEVDVAPTGEFGLGDSFVFTEDLFEGNTKVGEDGGECTVVRFIEETQSATTQCVATLSLPKGQITVQGLITFVGEEDAPVSVLPITGGSGAYKTARGELKIEPGDNEDRLTLFIQ
jgi:allene oxide cyclase-like protein